MTNKYTIFIILLCTIFLSACGADPRREAAAYETRAIADQLTLDNIAARQQAGKLNEIELQDAQRAQAIKDAGLANAQKAASWISLWAGIAITLSAFMLILSIGAGGSIAIVGTGKAVARAAHVKANLIYLDKTTGQFPQLLEYLGKGIYSLTDMNDHSTRLLDTRNEPDRVLVQGSLAIRHTLVLSNAAGKSKDPSGVAMIQPLIIDAENS